MSLASAESIRKKTVNNPVIKEHVKNILKNIEEKILEISSKESIIKVTLPKDFFVDGLSVKDAQRIIYYQVIKVINEQGYDLTIDTPTKTNPNLTLTIRWVSDMEAKSAKEIDKFIVQFTREAKEKAAKSEANKKKEIKQVDNLFEEEEDISLSYL